MAISPHAVPAEERVQAPLNRPQSRTRWYAAVLLAMSAVMYLGTAATPALLDDADASHALVSVEMLQRHDWAVMYMNGIRYLMKAPLHYWAVALSYMAFGQTAFATRLPVALAMVLLTLMCFEFGRRFFSPRAGLYAGLAVATSVGMFIFTRIMIPEAIYALEFTAIFYLFLRAWTGSLDKRLGYWGVAALCGLAVLTRGLVGIVFPLGAIVGFIIVTRSWERWRELHLASGSLIFLAIAAPWHILCEMRAPGFFWSYFINEHVNRALGTRYPPDYDAVPLLLWWGLHLVWFFPWIVFLPYALKQLPHPRTWGKAMSPEAQARLMLFVWAAVIIGFFSIEPGSRMEYYSFGCWPAIAVLLGLGLARAEEGAWLTRLQGGLAAIGLAIAGLLSALVWRAAQVKATGDISQFLTYNKQDYRLSMGHALDLTPQAFADLRGPAIGAAICFGVAFTVAWLLRRQKRNLAATLTVAVGMVGFFFCANTAYGIFEPQMSSHALAVAMEKYLRPQDPIVFYGEFGAGSSISFYTHRQVVMLNGRYNNLEFGSYFPDAPRIFLTDPEFPRLWKSDARVFYFVQPDVRRDALARLPADSSWLLARSGGKEIYVNHPLAPDEKTLAQLRAENKDLY